MNIEFPKDFIETPHSVTPGGKQWIHKTPNGKKISIVGGGVSAAGDGITTFEMWDFEEDEPRGYLTKEEINEYLRNKEFFLVKKDDLPKLGDF